MKPTLPDRLSQVDMANSLTNSFPLTHPVDKQRHYLSFGIMFLNLIPQETLLFRPTLIVKQQAQMLRQPVQPGESCRGCTSLS